MAIIKYCNQVALDLKDCKVKALNYPESEEWKIYTEDFLSPLKKVASSENIDLGGFDLKKAIQDNPDFLFVKVFAIKEDEVNDNGDYFPKEELKKSAHTFIGVPVFVNHQNDDIEKARGKVVHSWYSEPDKGIFTINAVDTVMYPKLARAIIEGISNSTSMAASVQHSVCSICHNCSSTQDGFCAHIKGGKNRKYSGTFSCEYKNSKDKFQDECPICSAKKNIKEAESKEYKNASVFEYNYGVKFIEDSFVVQPACHTCLVHNVLNPSEINKKLANMKGKIEKYASICTNGSCNISNTLEKQAGKQELLLLNSAMNQIEIVAKSMMSQKENVSMEYVSELVKVMSDIQKQADELLDMGYAQLPSPDLETVTAQTLPSDGIKNLQPKMPNEPQGQQVNNIPAPNIQNSGITPQELQKKQPQNGTGFDNSILDGGLGTITKPKFAENKKEEFLKDSSSVYNKIIKLQSAIINHLSKYSQNTQKEEPVMSNQNNLPEKTAAISHQPTDVITEKQLDKDKNLHPRTDPAGDKIIEKMIDDKKYEKDANVTDTASPLTRKDSPTVITEKQFENVKSGYVVRWGEYPEVITEKQWTDMSRMIGAELSKSQSDIITEKQLQDFLSKHKYSPNNDVITEKQLSKEKGDHARWASNESARIVKAATEAISDVIAYYNYTPNDIAKAASFLNSTVETKNKAALLTLVNALPYKSNERKAEKDRIKYFSKVASEVSKPSVVDALIVSASEHLDGLSADDVLHAIKHFSNQSNVMKKIEASAHEKMTKQYEVQTPITKEAELEKAFLEMNKSNDGAYQVEASFEDLGLSGKIAKKELLAKVKSFGNMKIAETVGMPVKTEMVNVDLNKNVVVAQFKEHSFLDQDEKNHANMVNENGYPDGDEVVDLDDPELFDEDYEGMLHDGPGDHAEYHVDMAEHDMDMDMSEHDMDSDKLGHDKGFENENEPSAEDLLKFPTERLKMDEKPRPVPHGQKSHGKYWHELEEEKLDNKGKGMFPAYMDSGLKARASKREELLKEAQLFGGQLGQTGGASQAPGAGAQLPNPAGGPGANVPGTPPPLESFDASTGAGEMDQDSDLKPKPPGSICCVCGSSDVNIVKGQGKCGNCGAEMKFKVEIEVTKWPDVIDDKTEDKENMPEDSNGEGFKMPTSEQPTGLPAAASTKNDKQIKVASKEPKETYKVGDFASVVKFTPKLASFMKEKKISLGGISPLTGSTNTLDLGKGNHYCLDTGAKYTVAFSVNKDNPNDVYMQTAWNPKTVDVSCDSCSRSKKAFASALKAIKVEEKDFDTLDFVKQAETALLMKKAGALKLIKTAAQEGNVVDEIKNYGANILPKFPIEQCREKIANRYGEDAIALSGPHEGQKLVDCICNSLKSAKVYSHGLAMKVASIWSDKDACESCTEDLIKAGFELNKAAAACEILKAKYAQVDDIVAEEVGNMSPEEPTLPPAPDKPDTEDVDPFENAEEKDTITVELPSHVLEEIDKAIDIAKGEDPSKETHHTEPLPEIEVAIDVPVDAAEAVENAAEDAIDTLTTDKGESTDKETVEEAVETPETEENPVEEVEEVEETPSEKMEEIKTPEEEVVEEEKSMDDSKPECACDEKVEKEKKEELVPEGEQYKEGEEVKEKLETEARVMNRGHIHANGEINLDINALLAKLNKSAKKTSIELAQDAAEKEGVKWKGGKPMGDEEKFDAKKPNVPTGNAIIGDEDPDLQKAKDFDVFTGNSKMGDEDINTEDTDKVTGGNNGAGGEEHIKTKASNIDKLNRVYDGLLRQQKLAEKVEREQTQDVKEIGTISNGKFINEEEKKSIGEVPKPKTPAEVGNVGTPKNEGFIGNEKESLAPKPTDKNTPEIPVSDARIGGEKENKDIKPEKENKATGNNSNTQKGAETKAKAYKLAGKMLEAGIISSDQLEVKVAELIASPNGVLDTLEKTLVSNKKGLKAASGGTETPFFVAEQIPDLKGTKEVSNLSSIFKLTKQNELAEKTDYDLKKAFNK